MTSWDGGARSLAGRGVGDDVAPSYDALRRVENRPASVDNSKVLDIRAPIW